MREQAPSLFRLVAALTATLSLTTMTGSCTKQPTTLILNVVLECQQENPPPNPSYLYLRLMASNGTVLWSNESNPQIIETPANGDFYQHIVSPEDTMLSSATHQYSIDAYLYSGKVTPSISPVDGDDAERLTQPAVAAAGTATFQYESAPHLKNGIQIRPGTQLQVHLTLKYFP